MTTPRMHTGRMSQRRGPYSGLLPTQTPAPTTGNSSGMGTPMPAATSMASVATNQPIMLGSNTIRRSPAGGEAIGFHYRKSTSAGKEAGRKEQSVRPSLGNGGQVQTLNRRQQRKQRNVSSLLPPVRRLFRYFTGGMTLGPAGSGAAVTGATEAVWATVVACPCPTPQL